MGLILFGLIRQPDAIDPASRCFALLCRRLAAVGLVRHTHEGPLDFAARVAVARPDVAQSVNTIVDLYIRGRYMPNPTAADIQRLSRLVKAFAPKKQRRSFSDTKRRKYFA
jgi:protein-glutamine gamma-glutamyltransferase